MRDDEQPEDGEEPVIIAVILRVIISYDVNKHQRAESVTIHRFVHGREVTAQVGGRKKRYFYSGLTSKPGVDKIGQSVLQMKENDADEFAAFLRSLHVPFTIRRVWVRPIDML